MQKKTKHRGGDEDMDVVNDDAYTAAPANSPFPSAPPANPAATKALKWLQEHTNPRTGFIEIHSIDGDLSNPMAAADWVASYYGAYIHARLAYIEDAKTDDIHKSLMLKSLGQVLQMTSNMILFNIDDPGNAAARGGFGIPCSGNSQALPGQFNLYQGPDGKYQGNPNFGKCSPEFERRIRLFATTPEGKRGLELLRDRIIEPAIKRIYAHLETVQKKWGKEKLAEEELVRTRGLVEESRSNYRNSWMPLGAEDLADMGFNPLKEFFSQKN